LDESSKWSQYIDVSNQLPDHGSLLLGTSLSLAHEDSAIFQRKASSHLITSIVAELFMLQDHFLLMRLRIEQACLLAA
jgi:hypothetical protein